MPHFLPPTCFDLHRRGGHVRRAVGRVALPVVVRRRGRRGRGVDQRGRVRHHRCRCVSRGRSRVQPVAGESPRRREGPVRRQGLVVRRRMLEVLQVVMVVVVVVVRQRGRRRLR